jgi:hypothetical protein
VAETLHNLKCKRSGISFCSYKAASSNVSLGRSPKFAIADRY